MRLFILALSATAFVNPAKAQLCSQEYESLATRAVRTDIVVRQLTESIKRIEQVPPDEAAFIERESSEALTQRNRAHFGLVYSRPYYHAYQVQKHYKVAIDNLNAARKACSVADQAIFLSVVLSRYQDLGEALTAYYDFDRSRPNRVLIGDAVQEISFTVTTTKHQVLTMLQCAVREMREPT